MLGELALVGYRKVNCSSCEVIYQCTNYRSIFLNWDVSLNGQHSHYSLNIQSNLEGKIDYIGSHPVKYEVISANTTFIRATVTMEPVELNGATIVCNGKYMTLSSSISSKFVFGIKHQVIFQCPITNAYNLPQKIGQSPATQLEIYLTFQ